MANITLSLPRPHAAQQKVIDTARRFNVVSCGRRFGKTALAIDRVINKALAGQPTCWTGPSYKMLMDAWRVLCRLLEPVVTDKSESEKRLELRGGGTVEAWSLDSAGDAARGRRFGLVIVDEAALAPDLERAWQSSLRPTLTDLKGSAWFLSTPRGMNYFKTLFDRGQDLLHINWKSWQMPTSSNPFIDPSEIAEAREDMTQSAFDQEFMALFVSWEGQVFRNLPACAMAVAQEGPINGHEYTIGCDWGRSNDYTVFTVMDCTTHAMVAMDRMRQIDYVQQRGRLQVLNALWKPRRIIAELNSIGQPLFEELQRARMPVEGFTTTSASKAEAIDALALAFEKADIRILNDPVLMGELQGYAAEKLPSGALRYGAPGSGHDDCVMSLAMAWSAVSGPLRVRMHPLFDIWKDDAAALGEQHRVGRTRTVPAPFAPEARAQELGDLQKRDMNAMGHSWPMPPARSSAPVSAPALPRCPSCGAAPAMFSDGWSCGGCRSAGPIVDGQLVRR